ncbi:MAG: hypothetical protein HY927_14955 [Elusimicrobia bacterium]|nr:hypothetical protein [Elusimicrobiota bacterium]
MVRPEVVEFIRRFRGQYSDPDIRKRLADDGVSPVEIDDAFRLVKSQEAAPAPGASRSGPWALVFFGIAVFTLVVVFAMRKASHIGGPADQKDACVLTDEQKIEVEDAVKKHEPELYAYPANIDAFLPKDLEDGDAGGYLLDAVKTALEAGGVDLLGGLASRDYKVPQAVLEKTTPKLEAALRLDGNGITGGLIAPRTYLETGSVGVVPVILARLGTAFHERCVQHLKEGRLVEAEGEAKKSVALGMLMMKDWASVSQAMGAAVAMDGYIAVKAVHEKLIDKAPGLDCVVRRMEIGKVTGMLAKDIKSYVPQPDETRKLGEIMADPRRLPELTAYLDSPALRQRYAELVLLGAIEAWSPGEVLAGRPDPSRGRILEFAGKHKDKRLAALAAGYAQAFAEVQGIYARLSPEDRRLVASGQQAKVLGTILNKPAAERLALMVGLVARGAVPAPSAPPAGD